GWLRDAARRGAVSAGLDTLLRWTLGYPADAAPVSGRYALGQVPDPAGPGTEAVQVILVWRSGVVDYLADVWDTIGAAEFEPGECTLAIDEVFTPAVLRGILHCPDCLQLLTDAPGSAQPHPLRCPVRLRRLLS
ncbi:MAG TPA: hypothetical protein VJT31_14245, partial [Rugosimonospora sp.]|nr:hypothetical protein [Rugosimonospora sp.]